jgi:hypothetical protein
MSALIWQLLAGSTKGIEYIIAIIGLGGFLLFLKWLKPTEERPSPKLRLTRDRAARWVQERAGDALARAPWARRDLDR